MPVELEVTPELGWKILVGLCTVAVAVFMAGWRLGARIKEVVMGLEHTRGAIEHTNERIGESNTVVSELNMTNREEHSGLRGDVREVRDAQIESDKNIVRLDTKVNRLCNGRKS